MFSFELLFLYTVVLYWVIFIVTKISLLSGKLQLVPTFIDKVVSCSVCSKVFPSSCYLRRHMLSHTKQRDYVCKECGLAFILKHHLKKHIERKHSYIDLEKFYASWRNKRSVIITALMFIQCQFLNSVVLSVVNNKMICIVNYAFCCT